MCSSSYGRGAKVGDDGGLLRCGEIGAAGHSVNQMWPLVAGVCFGRWKGMAFEAARDEKFSAGCEHVDIGVIGAGVGDQEERDFGWRG